MGVGGYIKLALRLLRKKDGPPDLEKLEEFLTLAEDNARQIEVLLAGLAQFGRASASLNRDTDLVEAVNQKIDSLSNRLDFGRLVDFEVEMPEGPTGLMVDRDWFGTVLENLVKNSVEACGGRQP